MDIGTLLINMGKVFPYTNQSNAQIEAVGVVLKNTLLGDSPFAKGYRNWKAQQEHVNNHLKADDNG